jgi:hypothetical protein
MIQGNTQIQAFSFNVLDGEAQPAQGGEKKPVKILAFQPAGTHLLIQFVFSLDQFDDFISKCQDRKIIAHAALLGEGRIGRFNPNGNAH